MFLPTIVAQVNLWFLIYFLFSLIASVNSQNDTEFTSSSTIEAVNCGDTQKMVDECFKDLPPHLMEFLQATKIAVNDEEISSKCTVFKRGMNCFDRYTERCLANGKFQNFQNNVAGARRFLNKFCDDHKFQEDYLRHKECFTYIQEDWKRCTKKFQHILVDELHGDGSTHPKNITTKFMQFCCTRRAYEICIYNSARYKCYKNSAKFARDTAKMLSEEKHFSNCRQYENLLCGAAAGRIMTRHRSELFLVPLLAVIVDFVTMRQYRFIYGVFMYLCIIACL